MDGQTDRRARPVMRPVERSHDNVCMRGGAFTRTHNAHAQHCSFTVIHNHSFIHSFIRSVPFIERFISAQPVCLRLGSRRAQRKKRTQASIRDKRKSQTVGLGIETLLCHSALCSLFWMETILIYGHGLGLRAYVSNKTFTKTPNMF